MRFSMVFCVFLALVSCSSPGRQFSGIEPVSITVEGSEFDVYALGENVRVIRMNFELLPRLAVIASRAIVAMELVTGCTVVPGSFSGDQAMAQARVKC